MGKRAKTDADVMAERRRAREARRPKDAGVTVKVRGARGNLHKQPFKPLDGREAFALVVDSSPGGSDPCTIGVFATEIAAFDHYRDRDDLHAYFWTVKPVAKTGPVPYVYWPRERVLAALANLAS